MKQPIYQIHLTDLERRLVLNALVEVRNSQIEKGKGYECLNDLIVKICQSKEKRFIGKSNETR